jgi:response regulator RpfG family c-di-GMP phosphodiesterase
MTKIPIFTCNKDIPAELENVFDTHYPNSKLIVNIDEPEEINKALSENPEVIISKIPILNTDSTEGLNLLKRQASQKKIPVILLADPGDNPDTLKEIIDVDSMVVLYLPFQPLELVTLISTLTKAKIAGKNKENAINDTSETNNNKQVENEEVSSNVPLMLKGIV